MLRCRIIGSLTRESRQLTKSLPEFVRAMHNDPPARTQKHRSDQLQTVGGMRSFGEMALEMLGMAVPVVDGISTGHWTAYEPGKTATQSQLLTLWDAHTTALDEKFPKIPAARFFEVEKAFGMWEATGLALIQYAVDNEIHHRGEGYVYLRALGIAPPNFWERD